MTNTLLKWTISVIGGFLAAFEPIVPVLLVGILFILIDSLSAYRLSQRAKKVNPKKVTGKFQSSKFTKVITSIIEMFIFVALAHLLGTRVFVMFDELFFANWAAGIYCFKEAWSILENESSCNGSRWAKVFQKVMVDKTERHFDINLEDLKDKHHHHDSHRTEKDSSGSEDN